ncbi:EAL domain-containing protein [Paracraurococcus lichenis]|uniref:EAL domain-containing protein n=1 Tax=Paracraurococcus lichenis TaxID=3064888 RepID=A0ABT9E7M1_9PROT|nr:EAL domain-containing protein [Paracraurococcus sp. LOR1-02]MDO9712202.1 EAL domain-containing protein [Paracraurococcus sp. LOR1-02]
MTAANDKRALRWRVLLGAAFGVAIALGALGYLATQREAALRDAEREVRNLSVVLAEWVGDGVRATEQLEEGVADWVRAEGVSTPRDFSEYLATRAAHDALRARATGMPRVDRVFLADLGGRLLATSGMFPPPVIDIGERDYFQALMADGGPDTSLGTAVQNKVDGKWSIFIVRRIRGYDGRLLGIAGAQIDLRRFEAFFGRLALGRGSSVALMRRDGTLLARHPWAEDAIGTSFARSDVFTKLLPVTEGGSLRSRSPLDGSGRVLGVQALDGYPLVIVATRAEDEVLAAWRREVWRVGLAVLFFDGLIVAGVFLAGQRARARIAAASVEAELALSREREAAARARTERDEALRAVFETGTAGVAELDAMECRFVRVNARFRDMTGRSEAELLGGLGPADVVHPEDREADLARWRTVGSPGGARDAEKRYLRPDGSVVWVRLSMAVSARDTDGRPHRYVAVAQDITESRTAAEKLRSSEEMLRIGQTVGRIGSFRRDLTTGALQCGPETREIFGLPAGDEPIPIADWMATVVPEDRERLAHAMRDAIARGDARIAVDYRIHRPTDGSLRHVEMRARYEFDAGGRSVGSVGVAIDVTERRQAEERLRASEAMLRLGMEVGRIAAYTRDADGDIHCAPEVRALHGLPEGADPISMTTWASTLLPEDRERIAAELAETYARRLPEASYRYRIRRPADGMVRHIEARTRYEYDVTGGPVGAVGVVIDVTESREAEARIAHLAHHDALTGLPNRILFRERLEEALARARRSGSFAVLCLDLDRFKEVNDTLGHPIGDALLCAVAARLRSELRDTDILARLGGDEFAIVQSSVNQPHDATALARRLVEVVGAPFEVEGHQISVGASVGVAVAPGDGMDPDALLKAADMALYRAKADGRGTWRFFEPEMDARMQMRRALELDLRRALAAGEFEVHYQPIVGVADRRAQGLEALVRWRHPERGLVPPDRFIPLCEEIGLIVPLGEWVLERACAEAVAWPGIPKVAVNLSPAQFASPGLVDAVAAALAASGLAPARLELEITETVMLRETEATLAILHRLKALGVRIAMDDFGTGYSSLSYLQRFPFDKVKIDRSFIRGLDESRQSNAIVRAVADLCGGLDMTTTAEGVETEEQFVALRRKGCGEAQGYLFSRPLPAAEVPAMLGKLAAAAACAGSDASVA